MEENYNAGMTPEQAEKARLKEKKKAQKEKLNNKNIAHNVNQMVHEYYTGITNLEVVYKNLDWDLLKVENIVASHNKEKNIIAFRQGQLVVAYMTETGKADDGQTKYQLLSNIHDHVDHVAVQLRFRCILIAVERTLVSIDRNVGVTRTYKDIRINANFI